MGSIHCDITPVEGVTVSVRGGSPTNFEVEWRDMRCLTTSSDADVSRNATPRASTDSARNLHGLVAILHKIVFGETQNAEGKSVAMGGSPVVVSPSGGPLVIYLQRRKNRACLRRLLLTTDSNGELMQVTTLNGTKSTTTRQTHRVFLQNLSEMCAGDDGFALVRETSWSELPSELWWHVLKCLTRREGKAVSCTCKMISHMVQLPAFVWAPAQLHLGLVQAQEAVRSDTSG